jgi:hypothetical protein
VFICTTADRVQQPTLKNKPERSIGRGMRHGSVDAVSLDRARALLDPLDAVIAEQPLDLHPADVTDAAMHLHSRDR